MLYYFRHVSSSVLAECWAGIDIVIFKYLEQMEWEKEKSEMEVQIDPKMWTEATREVKEYL
jgi:hypothetical protein